jgi:hypothetical protein
VFLESFGTYGIASFLASVIVELFLGGATSFDAALLYGIPGTEFLFDLSFAAPITV